MQWVWLSTRGCRPDETAFRKTRRPFKSAQLRTEDQCPVIEWPLYPIFVQTSNFPFVSFKCDRRTTKHGVTIRLHNLGFNKETNTKTGREPEANSASNATMDRWAGAPRSPAPSARIIQKHQHACNVSFLCRLPRCSGYLPAPENWGTSPRGFSHWPPRLIWTPSTWLTSQRWNSPLEERERGRERESERERERGRISLWSLPADPLTSWPLTFEN